MFAFSKPMTLASYIPKKKKVVTVLSSFHQDDSIDKDSENACKPNIITFYNITKSGVGSVDQKCAACHVGRNTCRWPMVIFYNLLNIAGINAHVIHKCNSNEGEIISERRLFLKAIGLALVRENIRMRAWDSRLEKYIKWNTCGSSASVPIQEVVAATSQIKKVFLLIKFLSTRPILIKNL